MNNKLKSWYVIANPQAGNAQLSGKKQSFLKKLNGLEESYEISYTEYAHHEKELAVQAISQGYRRIIAGGGDGTIHNIINGIFSQKTCTPEEITLAAIPLGTGNDWVKNNSIPVDIDRAIQAINNGKTTRIDIGKLESKEGTRYFSVLAGIGYDAYIVEKSIRYKKWGRISYLIAGILGLTQYRNSQLRLVTPQQTVKDHALMVIIGLGKYCGGGMQLTRDSDPSDGVFDISFVRRTTAIQLLFQIRKIYNGSFHHFKKVVNFKANHVSIEFLSGEEPFIEADGEIVGQGSFTAELLPRALLCIRG